MMDDAFTLAALQNTGAPQAFANFNSCFNNEGAIMSKLNLLASYNGGAVVKSAGKMKYERSGNAFTVTLFGQTKIHTALIQYHTNNELMF